MREMHDSLLTLTEKNVAFLAAHKRLQQLAEELADKAKAWLWRRELAATRGSDELIEIADARLWEVSADLKHVMDRIEVDQPMVEVCMSDLEADRSEFEGRRQALLGEGYPVEHLRLPPIPSVERLARDYELQAIQRELDAELASCGPGEREDAELFKLLEGRAGPQKPQRLLQ